MITNYGSLTTDGLSVACIQHETHVVEVFIKDDSHVNAPQFTISIWDLEKLVAYLAGVAADMKSKDEAEASK